MDILGIPPDRFDPALLADTDNLAAAALAAAESSSSMIEPSHLLVALGRIPGSTTAALFERHGIPVDVLCAALRNLGSAGGTGFAESLSERTASEATRAVFSALRAKATGSGTITERLMLAETLRRLEPAVSELLRTYGKVNPDEWIAAAEARADEVVDPFDGAGRLRLDAFSPGARRVLRTMAADAGALGRRRVGTVMLLHAMAAAPNGVIDQACLFLQRDIRSVRAQLLAMTGGRVGSAVTEVSLTKETIDEPLDYVLTSAAGIAAGRRATVIAESDLLQALLEMPGGLATTFFRDVGIDVGRLLRYATQLYQEPADKDVSGQTHIPTLEEALAELRRRVIGQEEVLDRLTPRIELITRALKRGYRMDDRPRGTFLFCGPSGTGKTMTARALAKVIYGSEDELVMFEMGQFNSRESINNFIGAPAGYVGFGEGKLTNALRDNPRRVLLFDEVEKADQRVFDALLRLLDEGRISDPAGPVRDARDSVVVLTSNLGAGGLSGQDDQRTAAGADCQSCRVGRAIAAEFGLRPDDRFVSARRSGIASDDVAADGGGADGIAGRGVDSGGSGPDADCPSELSAALNDEQLRQILEGFFRPEFLNRIDDVVVFARFGRMQLIQIAVAGLEGQAAQMREQCGVTLTWADEVPDQIAAQAQKKRPHEAARGVNRCVAEVVPQFLRLLDECEGRGERVEQVRVVVRDGKPMVERVVGGR